MSYFFWFLLFLAIPILVHLFNFRKAKQFLFTNVRFIQRISTETKSKTRLKHILILLSRMLAFIFLLVTFFAFQSSSETDSLGDLNSSSTSFYFDNSVSVLGESDAEVLRTLEEVVASSRSADAFFLTNDFAAFSNHKRSKQEILDEIVTIQASFVNRTAEEVLGRIGDTENIFIVSDFQEFSISDLSGIRADTTTNYHLIFKETVEPRNVFVDSVWLEKSIDDYSTYSLRCLLGVTSGFENGNIVIKLIDDLGNQISSVVKNLSNELSVNFSVPANSAASYYRILLSGDKLEYDNEFFIVVNKTSIPSILILSETPNTYLDNVFSNEDLFTLTRSANGQIDYESIQKTDLVVLNGYYRLPEGLVRQNRDEISFLIVPPDSIDLAGYSSEMGLQMTYNPNVGMKQLDLTGENVFLKGVFGDMREFTSLPSIDARFRLVGLHERILQLRGGTTFLGRAVESPIYFLTTPLSDEYTNLPNHALFLPLMYRIAERSVDQDDDLFANPGDYLVVPELILDSPPKIVSDNLEIIPEFFQQGKNSVLRVPVQLSPGFYNVVQDNDTLKSFGINLPKSESIFNGLSYDEIATFFDESGHVSVVSNDSENIGDVLLAATPESSIWKYALILALVFIVTETMLHRYLK